MIIKMRKYFA